MTSPTITNGVILAENDLQMRGLIRSVLIGAGQQVFPAVDGTEAMALARQFKARLVLLDIAMPRTNGLQACEAIHKLPGYVDVPIVMLTGHDDERLRAAAQRFGACDFITKPFRPNVLLARLARYLDIPRGTLPPGPVGDATGDAVLGERAMSWNIGRDAGSGDRDNPGLAKGREAMRIWQASRT
jgi:DNA-binding response OmpR family regulator